MIPEKLTICNFMSYKNPAPLDFSQIEIACVVGENGAGKSTLLEAITWALWGKARTSLDDELIYHNEQHMWVDFEFSHEGKRYRVIRKREKKRKGISDLQLLYFNKNLSTWEPIGGATIKETEEKIKEIIKLPHEIFINSAYLRQGHADEFTSKGAAERKKILGEILGLDIYEQAQKRVKEKAKIYEAEIEALEGTIKEVESELAQKETFKKEFKESAEKLKQKQAILAEEEKKLKAFEKDRNQYEVKKTALEHEMQRLSNLEEEGKRLKKEENEIKKELEKIKILLEKRDEYEKGYQKLQRLRTLNEELTEKLTKLSNYQLELGKVEAKEQEVLNKIERIKSIKECPTCLRILTKEEANKIISRLSKELKEKILEEKEKINEKIKQVGYSKEEHQKIKSAIKELIHFEEEKRKIEMAETQRSEKEKHLNQIIKSLEEKRNAYRQAWKSKNKLEKELRLLFPILEKWEKANVKVNQLREDLFSARETYGVFKSRLEELAKKEKIYHEKREKMQELKKRTHIFTILEEIFSKNGIQAMIIETILPEIEEEANKILQKITQGRMKMKFITSKEKKAGGEIETLEIKIEDNLSERDYKLFSGGEAFRIDLAIRVALSRVLSRRAGTKLQFLAIDEGFGSLDQAGKDEVADAINELKGEFEKILVITHINEFKNLFPTRIEVWKDEEGSHFEIVNL